MKDPRDIILAPVVSEKSYALMEAGVYTFKVHPSASKPEIRDAVQAIWGVEVRKPVLKERLSDGPQTADELLKEVKKTQEGLAGTWYFSDCQGPEAFHLPGGREMRKRFKDVKLVFAGDRVTIVHGKARDEVRFDIPLLVDAGTQRIVLGPPRLKFLAAAAPFGSRTAAWS